MTRQEYMEELKKYLKRLPQEDFDNAIEYFSEYFEEAGPEKEQQVMVFSIFCRRAENMMRILWKRKHRS